MNERKLLFRVGVVMLGCLIILLTLVVMFNEPTGWKHGRYTVMVKFPEAPGVTENTPVRKSGILIGRVKDVSLDDNDGKALVALSIDGNRKLKHNEVFRVVTSLLGDSVVDVVPSIDPHASEKPILDGESLDGKVAADPVQVVGNLQDSLSTAIGSVSDTSAKLGDVVEQVGRMLERNESKIDSVVGKLDRSLETIEQTVANANDVIDDPETRQQLKDTIAQLPVVLKETRETVKQMGHTVSLVEKNLEDINQFTHPLGEKGEVFVDRLDRGSEKLENLTDEMLVFARALNNKEGSLGQLVHNPQLYQSLNRAARNIEEVSGQLRPIIKDARVFTDKIARHPERLGVRGALQPSSGIK